MWGFFVLFCFLMLLQNWSDESCAPEVPLPCQQDISGFQWRGKAEPLGSLIALCNISVGQGRCWKVRCPWCHASHIPPLLRGLWGCPGRRFSQISWQQRVVRAASPGAACALWLRVMVPALGAVAREGFQHWNARGAVIPGQCQLRPVHGGSPAGVTFVGLPVLLLGPEMCSLGFSQDG